MLGAPDRNEATEYYFGYIDQVPAGDIRETLAAQLPETVGLLRSISDAGSLHRYAADKWSLREVVGHVNDCERLYVFRAFWFARGFDTPLPSFDQHTAVAAAASNDRSWGSLVDEFRSVRESTLAFFLGLPDEAWARRGVASDNPFSVRALAYLAAGHVIHHTRIVRERYLSSMRDRASG